MAIGLKSNQLIDLLYILQDKNIRQDWDYVDPNNESDIEFRGMVDKKTLKRIDKKGLKASKNDNDLQIELLLKSLVASGTLK